MWAGAAPTRLRTESAVSLSAGRRDGLIENRERVAHGSVPGFRQQRESIIVGFDLFASNQVAKLRDDGVKLDRAKTEVLASGADRLRNVLRLRRGQHENDVIRRLFQRFQQRVEGGVGDLVRFVENVNFESVAGGTVAGRLSEFADFIDATVRGGIDFDHVHGVSGTDFGAGFANATRLRHRMVLGAAIQSGREDAGNGGFADTAMAAEDVAVGGASLLDGVLEGAGDVLLPDDLGELLGTVFSGQDGITHVVEDTIIRDETGPWRSPNSSPQQPPTTPE